MLFRSELPCLWKFHWYPFSRLMQLPVLWARGEHRGSLHSLSRPGTSSTKQASLRSGFWELSRCLLFYSCNLSLAESSAFIGFLCLVFDTLKCTKGAHTLCEGCMVENIFTEVIFTTNPTVSDTGGDLDGYFKSITIHLKAKWNHWVIKPWLVHDTSGNIYCILK